MTGRKSKQALEKMSLKSKIEAVIYASEEPVTLQQLVGLLAGEAQAELDALAADQGSLPLDMTEVPAAEAMRSVVEAGVHADAAASDTLEGRAIDAGEIAGADVPLQPEGNAAEQLPSLMDEEMPEEAAVPASPAASDAENEKARARAVRDHVRRVVDGLIREYAESDRGIEIREVASGFRMGTKPEFHDAVRGFVKSLKPALKLTLPALETLAVVAYKQPVTAAEISEIRGVDSAGVLGGLMTRKLIATAGRKQVIGRPMLYKTTRDFLLRFGLKDVQELPSMEEFERMAGELAEQEDLPMEGTDSIIEQANVRGDAETIREANAAAGNEPQQENEEATAENAAGGNDEGHEAGSEEPGEDGKAPNTETEATEDGA